ncbi:MAG: diguanylate cyclase [Candidatus Omnitrophota bacterium]|jgi:diguanylate cyclase (GGDEF)-like protein
MKTENKLSLISRGLRSKLNTAFYLMSVVPILVCVYIASNYIFPQIGIKLDITLFILISAFIALLGFFVIKDVFDRILLISGNAKKIAAGDFNGKVSDDSKDEVGDLGEALNELTRRIRGNMDELKGYSEKTSEINLKIHKRIFILSDLLRISSLVSHGDKLENILKFILEKSCSLGNADISYLYIKEEGSDKFRLKSKGGINWEHSLPLELEAEDSVFADLTDNQEPLMLDKRNTPAGNIRAALLQNFKLNCTLALPILLKGRLIGVLGIGNKGDAVQYESDDIELLELFCKQVAIAIENDILTHRVSELEIKDALTGLYNEPFIRNRLEEEIKRAIVYRRPCAFVIFNIDNFRRFREKFGLLPAEATLKKLASLFNDLFTEVERIARIADNDFAVVLPEKNKRQAKEAAEEVRKRVESAFSKEADMDKRLTVSGGVSENPLDGINAEQLFAKAKEALKDAKTQGKNRIGVLSFKAGCQ